MRKFFGGGVTALKGKSFPYRMLPAQQVTRVTPGPPVRPRISPVRRATQARLGPVLPGPPARPGTRAIQAPPGPPEPPARRATQARLARPARPALLARLCSQSCFARPLLRLRLARTPPKSKFLIHRQAARSLTRFCDCWFACRLRAVPLLFFSSHRPARARFPLRR